MYPLIKRLINSPSKGQIKKKKDDEMEILKRELKIHKKKTEDLTNVIYKKELVVVSKSKEVKKVKKQLEKLEKREQ